MEKQKFLIFVIDDDPFYNQILSNHLLNLRQVPEFEDFDIQVNSYFSAKECLDNIHLKPEVVLLDYFLDESGHPLKGLYLLNNIKELCERCKVVLMSQQQAMLASVEFLQQGGAYDYIVKDTSSLLKISNLIEDILHKSHSH
jgi:two-component system, NtrC family, response regulator AtoC